MDFFQQVEGELQSLSSEARKKFPEVAEASERAVLRVRKMREQYAAALRQHQGQTLELSMFRSQDLLRPFLLACNHADAPSKMVSMALMSLQHVMQRDVLSPGDCPNVMRVLAIQAAVPNRDADVQIKILQTLVMVVNWKSCDMTQETVGQALSVCFSLISVKTPKVRSVAHMTIRQLVRLLFDRLGEEEEEQKQQQQQPQQQQNHDTSMIPSPGAKESEFSDKNSTTVVRESARRVFLDLCMLARGENGTWIKLGSLRRDMGVELVEDVLIQYVELFRGDGPFQSLLATAVCPMLSNLLHGIAPIFAGPGSPRSSHSAAQGSMERGSFDHLPLLARATQAMGTVATLFGAEGEQNLLGLNDMLSALRHHLDTGVDAQSAQMLWGTALVLECVKRILCVPSLVLSVYKLCQPQTGEGTKCAITDLIQCLPLLSSGPRSVLGSEADSDSRTGKDTHTRRLIHAADAAASQSLAFSPPPLHFADVSCIALHCSAAAAQALAAISLSVDKFQFSAPHDKLFDSSQAANSAFLDGLNLPLLEFVDSEHSDLEDMRGLCDVCWPSMLVSIKGGISHLDDAVVYHSVVEILCCTAVACGLLGAEDGLESIFSSLCNIALPSWTFRPIQRHWQLCGDLLGLVHATGNVLGKTWHVALRAIDVMDTYSRSLTPQVAPSTPSSATAEKFTGYASGGEEDMDGVLLCPTSLSSAISHFPAYSSRLQTSALLSLMTSLSVLSATGIASDSTSLSSDTVGPPTLAPSISSSALGLVSRVGAAVWHVGMGGSVSSAKESTQPPSSSHNVELGADCFLMRAMIDCTLCNSSRAELLWDLISAHLRIMAQSNRKSLCDYAMISLKKLMLALLLKSTGVPPAGVEPTENTTSASGQLAASAPGSSAQSHFSKLFAVSHTLSLNATDYHDDGESSGGNELNKDDANNLCLEERLFGSVKLFSRVYRVDTREAALEVMDEVLQSCGQLLDSAWHVVLDVLADVARGRGEGVEGGGSDDGGASPGVEVPKQPHPTAWGGNCLTLAFNTLKLVVDDFLERLPSGVISELISCVGAFGSQVENVNLSLTAIGMLWTACDRLPDTARLASWGPMLAELQILSVDNRPEVRNCAIHTLFSALTGNGSLFSSEQWRHYLVGITFPLLDRVIKNRASASATANTGVIPELKKGVKMVMHHSRDSERKQWDESAVLALQGLSKLMRAYLRFIAEEPWFCDDVWLRALPIHVECCRLGAPSQEVVLASIDGLATLTQLVSHGGLTSKAPRISTNMRVVDGHLRDESLPESVPSSDVQLASSEAFTSPDFAVERKLLWKTAWNALEGAANSMVNGGSSEIATAYARALVQVYQAGTGCEGEFRDTAEEGQIATIRLMQLLDLIVLPPPLSAEDAGLGSGDSSDLTLSPPIRAPDSYRPSISGGQRVVLEFLRDTVCSAWPAVLSLLARYCFGAGDVSTLSESFMQEAASTLVFVLENRAPEGAILRAFPSIVRESLKSCTALGKGSGDSQVAGTGAREQESERGTPPSIFLCQSFPVDPTYASRLKYFKLALEKCLPYLKAAELPLDNGPPISPHWALLMNALREFGFAWSSSQLLTGGIGRASQQALESGGEFALLLQDLLEAVAAAIEDTVFAQPLPSPSISDTAQNLVHVAGDLCCYQLRIFSQEEDGVPSGLPAVIPQTHALLDESVRILYRAAKGTASWGATPRYIRRIAIWELLRATWGALEWYVTLERALIGNQGSSSDEDKDDYGDVDDGESSHFSNGGKGVNDRQLPPAASLVHAENFCLVILRATRELDLSEPGLVTLDLISLVDAMTRAPLSQQPTPETLRAACANEDGDVDDEAERQAMRDRAPDSPFGAGTLLLPFCPPLLQCITCSAPRLRESAGELLGRINIPLQLSTLQEEINYLRRELATIRQERDQSRRDSSAIGSLLGL